MIDLTGERKRRQMDKMDREWRAWRHMCDELKRLGVDINAENELCERIKQWGERLVELRGGSPDFTESDKLADQLIG